MSHGRWLQGCVPGRLCFLGERVGANHVSTADQYGLVVSAESSCNLMFSHLNGVTLTASFSSG